MKLLAKHIAPGQPADWACPAIIEDDDPETVLVIGKKVSAEKTASVGQVRCQVYDDEVLVAIPASVFDEAAAKRAR